MSNLNNNTTQLEALLAKVNALPEAGGVDLPELSNEGTSTDLLSGKQLIDQEGNIVTGTMANNGAINKTMDGINTKSVTIPSGFTSGGTVSLDSTIDNEVTEQADLIAQIKNVVDSLPEAGSGEVILPDLSNPAVASDILSGKEAIDGEGNVITGTIATKTASDLTASGATVTVPAGYYATQATKSVATGSAKTPATTITKNPSISVNSSGLITASISGIQNVTPTVSAGYVSSGTSGTITVSGSATEQLTTQAAKTITPSKTSQTAVASGVYTTGVVTVNPIPSNYIIPTGTKNITTNGTHDVSSYASATVNVASTGEDVTAETNAYTAKISQLETAVTALETELASKASGGSGLTSCDVTFIANDSVCYEYECVIEVLEGGYVCTSSDSLTGGSTVTVLCNSILKMYGIYNEETGEAIEDVLIESDDGTSYYDELPFIYIGTSNTTITIG